MPMIGADQADLPGRIRRLFFELCAGDRQSGGGADGYPYKRSHLVALRPTKISALDPPSTWWPGER
jgi:hypothetical protein